MSQERILTAENCQSVLVPKDIDFELQETDQGILLLMGDIQGDRTHIHQLLLIPSTEAESPRHDDQASKVIVDAQKVIGGGSTELDIYQDGLKLIDCSTHPIRFIHTGIAQNRIAVENVVLDPEGSWDPPLTNKWELQSGDIIWSEIGDKADYQQSQGDGQQLRHISSISPRE